MTFGFSNSDSGFSTFKWMTGWSLMQGESKYQRISPSVGVWQATHAYELKAKNWFGSKLVKLPIHKLHFIGFFEKMASSGRAQSSPTSHISLHKINVNILLLQKYERQRHYCCCCCSAKFSLHTDTPTQTAASKIMPPCWWCIFKRSYRFTWKM